MLRFFWALFWVTIVVAKYEYDGETPTIKIKFSADTDAKESIGLLTLERTDTFVLSNKCAKKDVCTKYEHTNTYDPVAYRGSELTTLGEFTYLTSKLKGMIYTGTLIFGNYNDGTSTIKAVESVTEDKLELPQDAVVGLNFQTRLRKAEAFAITKLIQNAPDGKKVIIFRKGRFIQQLKDEEIKTAKGTFQIGEETLDGCGTFKYMNTISGQGWKIKAQKVTIGGTTLNDQTISFSFDKLITVPTTTYDDKFKDKAEADLSDISIEFGDDKTFTIDKRNLQNYGDDKHEKLEVLVKAGSTTNEIILGKNFLSDYCIALKSLNEDDRFQIGLAPISKVSGDSDWVKYSDGGNGGGGGGGNGGGGKKDGDKDKGAFTASCSVLLNILSASVLAFMARLAQ